MCTQPPIGITVFSAFVSKTFDQQWGLWYTRNFGGGGGGGDESKGMGNTITAANPK